MSDTKQKFIDAVVKGIAELPDRSSPEGHPELMQCTAEEVVDVLLVVYREHIAALEADAARMKDALLQIKEMTDAEGDEDTYRLDDPEGCFDTVFAVAEQAIKPDDAMKGGA